MTPVPLSPSKMGTETICDPVTAAGWLLAMAGRSKNTSSSVVWGEETGVEDSDEDGSESGSEDSDEEGSESGSESSGMGGRRLAGGPEGGSDGAEVGYPESLPEGSWDIHGKSLTLGCAVESNDATM